MQILEGVCKCADTVGSQEFFQANLIFCLLADRIDPVSLHGVLVSVLFHLCIDLIFAHCIDDVYEVTQCKVVALPSVFDLALYAVAIGYGYFTHVVAEGSNL